MRAEDKFSRNRVGKKKANRDPANTSRVIGLVLFSLGVLIGIIILGGSVYADFEASLFDIPYRADKTIWPFTCPILIDSDEVGIVRATVKNDSSDRVQRAVTGHISQVAVLFMREETMRAYFDPYESKEMFWEITADDAVYGHLILVKVYLFGRLSNPAREAGCGVLVFDLPGNITGLQVLIFLLVLGIALMFAGGRLWWVSTSPKVGIKAEESLGVLSLLVVILLGLITSYLGIFGISAGLFYLAMLMIGVMVPHFIFSRWKV